MIELQAYALLGRGLSLMALWPIRAAVRAMVALAALLTLTRGVNVLRGLQPRRSRIASPGAQRRHWRQPSSRGR
jgi:hypothetical protein